MKILFINPPRSPHNGIRAHAPKEALRFIHKKLIGPPLGLLTIATAVKDEHDIEFLEIKGELDLNPNSPSPKELVKESVNRFKPDVVAVTVITSEFNASMELLSVVKKINPKILTVAGGLHATICTTDFLATPTDIVVLGQGAKIFREIIKAKEHGRNFLEIAGVVLNDGEKLTFSKVKTKQINAADDDYIQPNRSLIERWTDTYRVGPQRDLVTYLFTSLGCPFTCSFCAIWPQFASGYFQRKVESVISELKTLDRYDVVRFADANTVVNVDFIDRLFDRIKEEGIKKEFVMDIRADTAVENPALIKKLAMNGLKVVICGFESFRDKELKLYNKSSAAGKIHNAIDIFNDNGIMLRGNYVIPPNYDYDDFKSMAEYASSHKVTYAGYTVLTPMPGTPLFNDMKNEIIEKDLSKYNFFNSVTKTKLPIEKFYEQIGRLWMIKKGKDVI